MAVASNQNLVLYVVTGPTPNLHLYVVVGLTPISEAVCSSRTFRMD
jgi:hypothetical protein